MITEPLNRGDIVFVNFGEKSDSLQGGYRPALVLQRNRFNRTYNTTIVAPITSVTKKTRMATHILIGKRFGLLERSMILLEQLQTIDQAAIDVCIGHIKDDDIMRRINEGLCKVLAVKGEDLEATQVLKRCKTKEGMTKKKKRQKKKPAINPRDIMCLCPVCRDSYRHRGFRVISAGGTKDICDLCNYRTGFDYAVVGLLSR